MVLAERAGGLEALTGGMIDLSRVGVGGCQYDLRAAAVTTGLPLIEDGGDGLRPVGVALDHAIRVVGFQRFAGSAFRQQDGRGLHPVGLLTPDPGKAHVLIVIDKVSERPAGLDGL